MNIDNILSKEVINKNNERFVIVKVEDNDDFKKINIFLNNKKIYNLYLCYKSGYIRFIDEEINKELDEYILNEEKEIERLKKIEEEKRRLMIEEELKERNKMDNAIKRFREEYYFLSNFYKCNVRYKEIMFTNAEAAFQAQKDLSRTEEFSNLSPHMARKLGKRVNLRKDWEEVKLNIMEEVLRCKFDQNPSLKEKLINTGDRLLIEGNDWNDTYWGVCRGKGQNNLGKLLMKLRKEYQS